MDIRPFSAYTPNPDDVDRIVALPYDVIDREQATAAADGNPLSFFHISKPEIDCPSDMSPYDSAVYAKGAKNFAQFCEQGTLILHQQPAYYIYRMQMGAHEQRGVFAAVPVNAYREGLIKKHELTRAIKEDDRLAHLRALHAQTSPVLLTYRQTALTHQVLQQAFTSSALTEVTTSEGVVHQVARVPDAMTSSFSQAFSQLPALYIADGHHRSAAADRYFHENTHASHFLAALFPSDELMILPYHRLLNDLNGLSVTQFLAKLEENYAVHKSDHAITEVQPRSFGLLLDNQWYTLRYHGNLSQDLLDSELLNQTVLAPILDIEDLRRSSRIDFIGGTHSLAKMSALVASGQVTAGIIMPVTPIDAMFTIADKGGQMPPKSTYFEPKLLDGWVSFIFK